MINLKKLRESRGYTQKDFAIILQLSQAYLSQIENGSRPINFELTGKLNEIFGKNYVNIYNEEVYEGVNENEANYLRRDLRISMEDVEDLKQENKALKKQIEELTKTNNELIQQILKLTNK